MARPGPISVVAEFPGTALKWIHLAEPVFAEQGLDVEKYTVAVSEEGDLVTVSLSSNTSPGSRGSTGKYPGYGVTFRKRTGKIHSSAYTR